MKLLSTYTEIQTRKYTVEKIYRWFDNEEVEIVTIIDGETNNPTIVLFQSLPVGIQACLLENQIEED